LEWLASEFESYPLLAQFPEAQVHFKRAKPHHLRTGNLFEHTPTTRNGDILASKYDPEVPFKPFNILV